jgi:hypothetical protein
VEAVYHIEDEPLPGPWQHLAVQPFWPLLAMMLAGSWLGLPWFVVNGFLVGSPTRWREAALAAGGFAGSLALTYLLVLLTFHGVLSETALPYAAVGITVWKLVVGYLLFLWQQRSIHLYEHFGGTLANGLPVVLVAAFLGRGLIAKAVAHPFWRIVLS